MGMMNESLSRSWHPGLARCRCASNFLSIPHCTDAPALLPGLLPLLSSDSELLIALVLETMRTVIRSCTCTAAVWDPALARSVLSLWAQHASNPLISGACIDVMHSLSQIPQVRPSLQTSALPVLAAMVSAPTTPVVLAAGAIDMACALLRPSSPPEAETAHRIMTPPIMLQLQQSDDDAILQESCDYLRLLFTIGGREALSWGGADPQASLQTLVSLVIGLLQPQYQDSACMLVGQLILTLLLKMPDLMASYIPTLLPVIIARLARSQHHLTRHGLVMVVAHIGRTNPTDLLDFLMSTGVDPAEQRAAVQYVLSLWTDWHGDLQGHYAILLSTAGLAAVLASYHPVLKNVLVCAYAFLKAMI